MKEEELKDDEEDGDRECRYCSEKTGSLFSICECKGSSEFIHAQCWDRKYRSFEIKSSKCEICKALVADEKGKLLIAVRSAR